MRSTAWAIWPTKHHGTGDYPVMQVIVLVLSAIYVPADAGGGYCQRVARSQVEGRLMAGKRIHPFAWMAGNQALAWVSCW